MNFQLLAAVIAAATIPVFLHAQTPTTYAGLVERVLEIINVLIPGIFALVFLVVLWRIIDAWILHADDPGKRDEGKRLAIIAVVVVVLMVSTWGVVALLRSTFFGS